MKYLAAVFAFGLLWAQAPTISSDSNVNPAGNFIAIKQYDCRPYMKSVKVAPHLNEPRHAPKIVMTITPEAQEACVADPKAVVKEYPVTHNLRVNGGVDIWSACLFGTTGTCGPITYIAIGTGTATPAVTDTVLGSELTTNGLARKSMTFSHNASNPQTCGTTTFTYTGSTSVTVTEVGAFNASSGGTLVTHALLYAAPTVTTSGNTIVPTYCFNF